MRETKSAVILAGSEEIMLDLGIKLASRMMPLIAYNEFFISFN